MARAARRRLEFGDLSFMDEDFDEDEDELLSWNFSPSTHASSVVKGISTGQRKPLSTTSFATSTTHGSSMRTVPNLVAPLDWDDMERAFARSELGDTPATSELVESRHRAAALPPLAAALPPPQRRKPQRYLENDAAPPPSSASPAPSAAPSRATYEGAPMSALSMAQSRAAGRGMLEDELYREASRGNRAGKATAGQQAANRRLYAARRQRMGPPVVHADVDHHMLLLKLSQEAERAQALFKEWDVNDSGTVSVEEFHRALGALGIGGVSQADAHAVFTFLDADGDGEARRDPIAPPSSRHHPRTRAPDHTPPARLTHRRRRARRLTTRSSGRSSETLPAPRASARATRPRTPVPST